MVSDAGLKERDGAAVLRLSLGDLAAAPAAFRGAVAAVGSFDGIHRGHQGLIATAQAEAERIGTKPLVITFEPHPRTVLRPDLPTFRLTSREARRRILGALRIERVVEIQFDRGLAALDPGSFVRRFLVDALAVRGVVMGEDFRFGKDRAGDPAFLADAGRGLGFTVRAISPVTDESGVPYSSGLVRSALEAGDMARANRVLGYRWFVSGDVVRGDQRGRELGYPTANLMPPDLRLRHGIYAVTAAWPGQPARPAVVSFGVRPTFGGGEPVLEAHVFDFDGDLYGRELTVTFLDWLRPEARFDGIDALIRQMDADSAEARAINAKADGRTALDLALAAPG